MDVTSCAVLVLDTLSRCHPLSCQTERYCRPPVFVGLASRGLCEFSISKLKSDTSRLKNSLEEDELILGVSTIAATQSKRLPQHGGALVESSARRCPGCGSFGPNECWICCLSTLVLLYDHFRSPDCGPIFHRLTPFTQAQVTGSGNSSAP